MAGLARHRLRLRQALVEEELLSELDLARRHGIVRRDDERYVFEPQGKLEGGCLGAQVVRGGGSDGEDRHDGEDGAVQTTPPWGVDETRSRDLVARDGTR